MQYELQITRKWKRQQKHSAWKDSYNKNFLAFKRALLGINQYHNKKILRSFNLAMNVYITYLNIYGDLMIKINNMKILILQNIQISIFLRYRLVFEAYVDNYHVTAFQTLYISVFDTSGI